MFVALTVATPAGAAKGEAVAAHAGFDGAATGGVGGYGWILVHYERSGLGRGARFSLDYNTDTLRLTVDRARYGRVELAAQVAAEALLAGVQNNYFRDGHDDRTRGFFSSYVTAAGGAKVDLAPHFIELTAGVRRWFFDRSPTTDANLVLPPEAWVGEVRLRYTFWQLAPDPSLWEANRPWWRVRGIAFGVELSGDLRSEVAPWGAVGGTYSPADPRNDPAKRILGVHTWLRAGAQVHRRVRLQVRQEAHLFSGEDDLVRLRIGGMNPYTVPLAGTPWGAYLGGRLCALEGSLHVNVAREHEVGILVDGVLLEDPRRVGDSTLRVLAGIGAFADLRLRKLQVDLRAGWSPTTRPGNPIGSFSAAIGLGWRLR